jgi:C-terminal processing protease CtpA/Prc
VKSSLPLFFFLAGVAVPPAPTPTLPPVLAEIDRHVREEFWDPKFKGVDWSGAVQTASLELAAARDDAARDAVYDRLLEKLSDSHTFRVPAGRLPARNWGTVGLRIGQDGDGYAVKGILPGSPAERAGMHLGDRVLALGGRAYGKERVSFRDLFLVFEGPVGSSLEVTWQPAGNAPVRTDSLVRTPEESGDALVWRSARVIRRDGHLYGYVRLWGLSAETALALVDLLLDREEVSRVRIELSQWKDIEALLTDVRANSGGYDPNILATFLRGRWSSGSYILRSRSGARVVPPEYPPLPVALLVNSGTASAGESLALQFRRHGIGPIVGEATAGMASGGASPDTLSDNSSLWISRRAVEDLEGRSYEGHGVPPDVAAADRPAPPEGEEPVVEAAIKALAASRKK